MRTKTIILSAAALAAGLLSSQAQVYSANVVGYVNLNVPPGFVGTANPLNANGTPLNSATNVFPNSDGHLDGLEILLFNPLTSKYFTPALFFNSAQPTGFEDAGGNVQPTPTLPIGQGFVFFNGGAAFTNTLVGEVKGFNSATVTFSNSVTILSGFTYSASPLPIGGRLDTTLQLTNVAGSLDGLRMQKVLANSTLSLPYVFYDSGSGTGFSDIGGSPLPAPSLAVGETMIFQNSGAPIQWIQKLP